MNREIKFRAFENDKLYHSDSQSDTKELGAKFIATFFNHFYGHPTLGQFTGLKDKNGKEIYEGDIIVFSDKWEWYKGKYGIKMCFANPEERAVLNSDYEKEKLESRVVEIPDFYEWATSEIQKYWEIVGNIYQNPELLNAKP